MTLWTLWIIFASMTAAAIFAVLWPLGCGPRSARGGSDLLVYKDQLQEIDRDCAAGQIGEVEAEAAWLEVSRRLLAAAAEAAAAAEPRKNLRRHRAATLAVLVILPLGPPSLYLALGSPNLPGQPSFARVNAPHGRESIASLVSQVEAPAPEANPSADGSADEMAAAVPEAGATAAHVDAAANMSDDRRLEMIRGMVARLADRLHQEGGDVEGWLRLMRAYVALGDRDKARDAAADAKRALADHPAEIKRIDDFVKGLGLEG